MRQKIVVTPDERMLLRNAFAAKRVMKLLPPDLCEEIVAEPASKGVLFRLIDAGTPTRQLYLTSREMERDGEVAGRLTRLYVA